MSQHLIPADPIFPDNATYSEVEALDLAQRIYLRASLTRSLDRLKNQIKYHKKPVKSMWDISQSNFWTWQHTKSIWHESYYQLTKNLGTLLLTDKQSEAPEKEELIHKHEKVMQSAAYVLQTEKSLHKAKTILEKHGFWHEPTWRHLQNAMNYYKVPEDTLWHMNRSFLANCTHIIRSYIHEEKQHPPLKKGIKMLRGNLGKIALFGGLIGGLKEVLQLAGTTSPLGVAAVLAVPFLWGQIKEGGAKEVLKKLGGAVFSGYVWKKKIQAFKAVTTQTRKALVIMKIDQENWTEEQLMTQRMALHNLALMNRRLAAHPDFLLNEYNCVPKLTESLLKTQRQILNPEASESEGVNIILFTPTPVKNFKKSSSNSHQPH